MATLSLACASYNLALRSRSAADCAAASMLATAPPSAKAAPLSPSCSAQLRGSTQEGEPATVAMATESRHEICRGEEGG
jgi:hypothetical protein